MDAFLLSAQTGLSAFAATLLAFNLAKAPRLEKARAPSRRPKASVLVPARNEEANLGILLPMLEAQDWERIEILVLDDSSADGTARIAEEAASRNPKVTLLRGRPLPAGWLGKTWACSQLAEAATGDVLLFVDADVRPGPGAVTATLGAMEALGAGALTCLPRQVLGTWAERAVVPLVLHLPVLCLLPIPLIPKHPHSALSLGVGPWFAFTRATYAALGGHASVRTELAEDMALARLAKAAGLAPAAALSSSLVAVRMYRGFREVRDGFGRTLSSLTGTGLSRPALVIAAYALFFVSPWILAGLAALGLLPPAWALPGAFLLAARLGVAVFYREPPTGWLWHPVGSLLVPAIAFRSWLGFRRGTIAWKGRVVEAAFAGAKAGAGPGPISAGAKAGAEGGGVPAGTGRNA